SGVGKSRLMEEMRALALVQGVLAVWGGAVSNGGSPYEMWREPLRRLVLETDLTDSEASVLKSLIPDISRLLERPIADAPELDPQAAQDRLINTVESLVRRQTRPLAIFLDDLHWAGSESLIMLDRISRLTDRSLFIIANYRDDETPELSDSLPHARTLKLNRLPPESIQQLSESMLGQAGRRPEVVDLLQRETEGNVFFIVEVVRTLAEAAGQLDLIGVSSLPDSVFAGGMQNVIQRRLDHLPADAHPLLQFAAVAGRQIDLLLLSHFAPEMDLSRWLTTCSNTAVLEVRDDRWRFAHDKFREVLLNNLSPEQRQQLHRRVAEAIETVYHDQLDERYAVLAHHWSQAQVASNAIVYLEKAGAQALANFANEEALRYFGAALRLADEANLNLDPMIRARWLRQIGQAYWGIGNLAALRENVEGALQLHNRPIPTGRSQLGLALLRQVGVQLAHRLRPQAATRRNQETVLEIIRAYKLLGQAYFFLNEANLTIYVTLQQLNLAEHMPPTPELAEAYVNMCLVAGLIPMHSLARTYEKRGIEVAEQLKDMNIIGLVTSVVSLYHMGIGQWQTARDYIQRSTTNAEATGDRRLWESVSGVRALVNAFQGRFDEAIAVFREVYESSRRSGNTQTYLWGMLGQAENLLPAGQFEAAQAFLEEVQTVPMHKFGRDSEIRANALMAIINFRQNRLDQALPAAETAYNLINLSPPTSSWLLQHYAFIAEIYLSLWETGTAAPDPEQSSRRARQMCKVMGRFARTFPIAGPRAALCQGWLQYLEGKPDRARRTWEAGLLAARRLGMPYEAAKLHLEIGERFQDPNHLREALEQFEQTKASYDADRTRSSLSNLSRT
ncbi:MAG TPA: AAA family ATPase, partial [Spirillospora sp.]|nr:AAA family ATPase [Spirillospora sp.]